MMRKAFGILLAVFAAGVFIALIYGGCGGYDIKSVKEMFSPIGLTFIVLGFSLSMTAIIVWAVYILVDEFY